MILSVFIMILGLTFLIFSYLLYSRYEEMVGHNQVNITKKQMLKIVFPQISAGAYLLDNQVQVDIVRGWSRKMFKWYIIGENVYYVIDQRTGKKIKYQSYDLIPKKDRRMFDLIDIDKKE